MDFLPEKAQFTPPDVLGTKVAVSEVERFVVDVMRSLGVDVNKASCLAKILVAADTRGHYSHGLQRIDMYVSEVRNKCCDGNADPVVVQESVSTGLVDGRNGLGPVVGQFCMDMAIRKARNTGIGWVVARDSNHYGIAGYYSMMALKEGFIGMSFTNACSGVAVTRGQKGVVGTNPISVAAPGRGTDSFVLDMATSVVSSGKVEMARLKKEAIPSGWGTDKGGELTSDPNKVLLEGGWLLPLGGTELHSGYKGFGLGMMVEIFCGILSGGEYGQILRDWREHDRPSKTCHCFVAINPEFFAPGFTNRMDNLMTQCRNVDPVDPNKPVLVAGDPERQHIELVEHAGGITYHINQIRNAWQLARMLGVAPMKTV